ncbi:hypothetical protein GGD41_001426 [Paraburkholderia bryophila]|uniref:Uncharacterized protein n=1 Tax=Paraburkholderia bryophila TaxID=420952 RepID=A0A7Y9W5W9_9BURK|nr:hypothetical protein [Paraburkholderia bryophila]
MSDVAEYSEIMLLQRIPLPASGHCALAPSAPAPARRALLELLAELDLHAARLDVGRTGTYGVADGRFPQNQTR